MGSDNATSAKRKASWLLGIGYWVQGFRGFPWTAVYFFLKDVIKVTPSTLQLLQSTVLFPMVLKPLYGVVSDSVYFRGQHRIPYIYLGAILQSISWFALALFPTTSIFFIAFFLTFGDFGASIAEVANEAIVAELGNQPSSSIGELQSFVWIMASVGGVLGNLSGGVATERFYPQTIFLLFGFITLLQFFITVSYHESSINLSKAQSASKTFKKQLSDLGLLVRNPEILKMMIWVSSSFIFVPNLVGTMFYYQTEALHMDPSLIGVSKVVGQGSMIIFSVIYHKLLASVPAKKLAPMIQFLMAMFMLSDILFVKGFYRNYGLPDTVYAVFVSGLMEVLPMFKFLPFQVLVAQLCPKGLEGSLMAIGASLVALSLIVGGYLGAMLAGFSGVTGKDFRTFPRVILIQAACTVVPVLFSGIIPDQKKTKNESLEEENENV